MRNVRYHSGQPWVRLCDLLSVGLGLIQSQPHPANLMVGFYAIGDPSEPIRTDLDNELEGSHTRMSVPNSP